MTKKPISTISFNTQDFLKSSLDELITNNQLQSYYYIEHQPEKDTTKLHYHVLLIPNRPIDPQNIRKLFLEPDIKNKSNLMLGCLPFTPSKLSDWLLYAIHYPPYLLSKGLTRINTYNITQLVSNEPFYCIEQLFREASEQFSDNRIQLFLDRMKDGDSLGSILSSGLVPPNQIVFYEKLYKLNSRILGQNLDTNENLTIPF